MCGISGFITKQLTFDTNKANFIEQALYAGALRGMHATGIFTVNEQSKAFFAKDALPSSKFIDQEGISKYVRGVSSATRAAIAHNRHATSGGRGYGAAHPFCTPHVTLVHNGTLTDYHKFPEHEQATSDSARLTQALSDGDPGGLDVLREVRGAYALVWYDNRNSSLYIAKNDERPLSYIATDHSLYFASEGTMLSWLMARNGITDKIVKPAQFPLHTLLKWDLSNSNADVSKPVKTKYEPPKAKVYPVASCAPTQSRWWDNDDWDKASGHPKQKVAQMKKSTRHKKMNARFKKLGLKLEVGQVVEVMEGEITGYRNDPLKCKNQGWFTEEVATEFSGTFTKGIYADVHQIPVLTEAARGLGMERDSYYATVEGIVADTDENSSWAAAGDIVLLCRWQREGMSRENLMGSFTPAVRKFLADQRWRYSPFDSAQHKFPNCSSTVTAREWDLLTDDMACELCELPASTVGPQEMVFDSLGETFYCQDCLDKETRKKKH